MVCSMFSARARAYVTTRKSGWYSLMVRSDDVSELWMAVDGDTNNLVSQVLVILLVHFFNGISISISA